jgi:hypothetical protein
VILKAINSVAITLLLLVLRVNQFVLVLHYIAVHSLADNSSAVLLKLLLNLLVLLLLAHQAVLFLHHLLVALFLLAQAVSSHPHHLAALFLHPLALVTSAHLILTLLTVMLKAINFAAITLLLLVLRVNHYVLVLLYIAVHSLVVNSSAVHHKSPLNLLVLLLLAHLAVLFRPLRVVELFPLPLLVVQYLLPPLAVLYLLPLPPAVVYLSAPAVLLSAAVA